MSSLKKISLKDIAEATGVSTALVSFVLNGKRKSIAWEKKLPNAY